MPEGPPGPCSRPRPKAVPPFWGDLAALGWLGLHLPEARGGSGFGLPELVVVVEELGRAVAPGPFVPTVIASAVIDAAGSEALAGRLLPGLADGSVLGGVAVSSDVTVRAGGLRDGAGRRWAAAWPTCSSCRRVTTPSWSTWPRAASRSTCPPTSTRRGAAPG